ncbi:MAG: arginine repressor [Candidatus Aminicenantes bacterium]|nr:arginine repressor [Candidatus Aminicenantes bacterium]
MHNYAVVMNNFARAKRREALRALLREQPAGSQTELLRALRKRGLRATQATISRDLQTMGATRVRTGPGEFHYQILDALTPHVARSKVRTMFRDFVIDVRGTGSLILVKTTPGNASGVASLIDHLRKPEVLGTVAGDDTILVVVDGEKKRADVERDFQSLR